MKRKLLTIFSGVLLIGVLAGCEGYGTGDIVENGDYKVMGNKGNYDVLQDLKTGCLYLEPHSDYGLTPYYDKNGEVKGCGENTGVDF